MLPVFALGIKPIFPAKVEWSGSLDDAVAEALKIIRWSLDRHTWFSKFYFLPQDQLFSRVIPSGNPDEKRGLSYAIFHDKQKVWRGTLFFVRSKAKSHPPYLQKGKGCAFYTMKDGKCERMNDLASQLRGLCRLFIRLWMVKVPDKKRRVYVSRERT